MSLGGVSKLKDTFVMLLLKLTVRSNGSTPFISTYCPYLTSIGVFSKVVFIGEANNLSMLGGVAVIERSVAGTKGGKEDDEETNEEGDVTLYGDETRIRNE